MTGANAITAFSAAVAAISFVIGVSAWKREFVGKRRIELAETVLAKFYEAAEAIRAIRNPFGWSEEGKSRQRAEGESAEQTQVLDRAYVLVARYNEHLGLFAELQSLKFRYMATFGKPHCEPFKELCDVLNAMRSAADELGRCWWPRELRGQLSDRDVMNKSKCEAVFWRNLRDEEDETTRRVEVALGKVEMVLQHEARSQRGWLRQVWSWCTGREQRRTDAHASAVADTRYPALPF